MAGQVNEENVEKVFTYQQVPNEETKDRYREVNKAAQHLAETILDYVPNCADRSAALRSVREARMWANAAIALNGEV